MAPHPSLSDNPSGQIQTPLFSRLILLFKTWRPSYHPLILDSPQLASLLIWQLDLSSTIQGEQRRLPHLERERPTTLQDRTRPLHGSSSSHHRPPIITSSHPPSPPLPPLPLSPSHRFGPLSPLFLPSPSPPSTRHGLSIWIVFPFCAQHSGGLSCV